VSCAADGYTELRERPITHWRGMVRDAHLTERFVAAGALEPSVELVVAAAAMWRAAASVIVSCMVAMPDERTRERARKAVTS